ncbi:hypothetical protein DFQ26_003046, partial [Actinomortierella ambigua]
MTALVGTPAPTTNATDNVEGEGEDKAFGQGSETQSLPDDHNDDQKHNSPERREMRGNREQEDDQEGDGEMDQGSVHFARSEQPRSGLRFRQQRASSPLDLASAVPSTTAEATTIVTITATAPRASSAHQVSLHPRSAGRPESSSSSSNGDERSEDEIAPSDLPRQENNQDQRQQSPPDAAQLAKPFQEVAFKCRKEMICPLCRHLHKDQPFQLQGDPTGSSASSTRASSPDLSSLRGGTGGLRSYREVFQSRNSRHSHNPTNISGVIHGGGGGGGDGMSLSPGRHLQQHLRNLMQHQRRNYLQELATHEHPTSGTVLSIVPSFFGESMMTTTRGMVEGGGGSAAGLGTPGAIEGLSGLYLSTTTWLMVYGVPFAAA